MFAKCLQLKRNSTKPKSKYRKLKIVTYMIMFDLLVVSIDVAMWEVLRAI